MNVRSVARLLIPRPLRLELLRLQRLPVWILETPSISRMRISPSETVGYEHILARHCSPLKRSAGEVPAHLQTGKERNVAIASARIDRLLVRPYETFSYHHTVGRPSILRGFRPGLELHDGRLAQGIGGGCCQISNMLYLLALRSGMKITERFRHGSDLFPDHGRTVPFGCGATVFYNYADLRFENPLDQLVMMRLRIEDEQLIGEIWSDRDPGWTTELYEADHRRYREGRDWIRENWIRRRFVRADGSVLLDQEVAHNRARILYALPDEAEEAGTEPSLSARTETPCCEPR